MDKNELSEKNIRNMELDNFELVSDGFHTFEELYYHRMILFSLIVSDHSLAWKSKLHNDGTMFDDYFIVGIGIEIGEQFTYHYKLEFYDLFQCKELEKAPEWDGHTTDDIMRLIGDK
jgi:hypothetical protein